MGKRVTPVGGRVAMRANRARKSAAAAWWPWRSSTDRTSLAGTVRERSSLRDIFGWLSLAALSNVLWLQDRVPTAVAVYKQTI